MNRRGFFGAMTGAVAGAIAAIAHRSSPAPSYGYVESTVELVPMVSDFYVELPTGEPQEYLAVPVFDINNDPVAGKAVYDALVAIGRI